MSCAGGSEVTCGLRQLQASADRDLIVGDMGETWDGAALRDLLTALTAAERRVVTCVMLGGLSHAEASRRLGISASTSRVLLSRALKKLRQLHQPLNRARAHADAPSGCARSGGVERSCDDLASERRTQRYVRFDVPSYLRDPAHRMPLGGGWMRIDRPASGRRVRHQIPPAPCYTQSYQAGRGSTTVRALRLEFQLNMQRWMRRPANGGARVGTRFPRARPG